MHCRINQMPTFFRRSVFAATTRFKPLSISLFRQTQRCQLDRLIYNWNLVRMASFENANVRSCHDLLVSTAARRAQYSARQVAAPFDTRVSRRCRPCSRSLRDYFVGVRFLMTTCLANNLQQGNTGGGGGGGGGGGYGTRRTKTIGLNALPSLRTTWSIKPWIKIFACLAPTLSFLVILPYFLCLVTDYSNITKSISMDSLATTLLFSVMLLGQVRLFCGVILRKCVNITYNITRYRNITSLGNITDLHNITRSRILLYWYKTPTWH